MDEHVYKSHNKTLLMYHLVFPAKYRRKVFTSEVEASLKEICLGIEARYEMRFIEIGLEEDHVHLLVQGIPTMAVNEIVRIIKSLTAREIFRRHPKIKRDMRSNIKGDCYEKEMQIKTGSLHRGARW